MPPTARRNLAGAALLALLLPLALARAAHAAPAGPAPLRPLDERTLGIGESHNYFFPMKAGEYLRIDVEQNDDIDAGIRLYDSRGKLLFHGNSYTGTHGAETMSWIAEKAEVLRVEVYAWESSEGRYSARSDGPRLPSIYDRGRMHALVTLFEGVRLQELEAAPPLDLAENHYRKALALWSQLSEPRWRLMAQRHLAYIRYLKGDRRESSLVYRQLLPQAMSLLESEVVLEAVCFILDDVMTSGEIAIFDELTSIAIAFLPGLQAESSARRSKYLAEASIWAGRLGLAIEFLNIEVNSRSEETDRAQLSGALGQLGRVLRRLGRIEDALQAAERQAAIAELPDETASALLSKGLALIAAESADQALPTLEAASRTVVSRPLAADIAYATGWANFDLERYSVARDYFHNATSLRPTGSELSNDWAFLALSRIKLNDLAGARLDLKKAEQLGKSPDENIVAFLHRVRSELLYGLGLWAEALSHLDKALLALSKQRRDANAEVLRASYWSTKTLYIDYALDLLHRISATHTDPSLPVRAFMLADENRASVIYDRLAGRYSNRAASGRSMKSLESKLASIDSQIATLKARMPDGWRLQLTQLVRERSQVLLQKALAETSAERSRTTQPRPTFSELQGSLKPDEQFVSFFLGARQGYAFVVDRRALKVVTLPARKEIEETAQAAIQELRNSRNSSLAAEHSRTLSRLLLKPLRDHLWSDRIIVSLDGILHRVPFSALEDPQETSSYILERRAVSFAPSLAVLRGLRQRAQQCKGAALVVAEGDRLMSRDELAISRFDSQFLRIPATRQALLDGSLAPYCHIHFATHGISDSSWPDSSSLILSESDSTHRIYAFEVSDLAINSRTVVLAACESGAGDVRGEGYFGLPAAFLGAGAQSVLATLWPVDSLATSEFNDFFYANLSTDRDVLTAFTRAQRQLKLLPGRSAPAFWAGFVLIGAP